MIGDHRYQGRGAGQTSLDASVPSATPPTETLPNIALWTPTLFALLLSGVLSGGTLGAADGVTCYFIVGVFPSLWAACLWGSGLGVAGGVLWVLGRRLLRGPDISVEVGTALGLLYGIVPGLAVLCQAIASGGTIQARRLAYFAMACSMIGLLVGGFLDRITDAVVARVKLLQRGCSVEPSSAPDRPHE